MNAHRDDVCVDARDDERSSARSEKHIVRQEGDEMCCSCGLRWDVHDPEPPEGH